MSISLTSTKLLTRPLLEIDLDLDEETLQELVKDLEADLGPDDDEDLSDDDDEVVEEEEEVVKESHKRKRKPDAPATPKVRKEKLQRTSVLVPHAACPISLWYM